MTARKKLTHHTEPMTDMSACERPTSRGSGTSDWTLVNCPACIRAQAPIARKRARYFGRECVANAGSTFADYHDDLAYSMGRSTWSQLDRGTQFDLKAEFVFGQREERAALKGGGA